MDSANEGGWTPLMYASYIGHELVVQQLLEAGVCVNSTNNKGQSPLALATSCGNDKTAELLIKVCNLLKLIILMQSDKTCFFKTMTYIICFPDSVTEKFLAKSMIRMPRCSDCVGCEEEHTLVYCLLLYFSPVVSSFFFFMVALWNRADHYIFAL